MEKEKVNLVIKNVKIVLTDKVIKGGIAINNGKIASVVEGGDLPEAESSIEAKGKYVLPGLIDCDTHWRVPGLEHKEDIFTGSSAAAAGGITTALEMPNTTPPTTTLERLEEKLRMFEGKSVVDYGLYFGGAIDNLEELEKLEPKKIPGVKFWLAGHETTPTTVTDLGIIYRAFEILARKGINGIIHGENQFIINELLKRYRKRTDFKAYCDSRPNAVVLMSVLEMIALSWTLGIKIHICHVSTKEEVQALQWAKESLGLPITYNFVGYHLSLTDDNCEKLGARSKVSPVLKSKSDQDFLWQAVEKEWVDCIASEHTPHTLEEKSKGVWEAPSGMPGAQELLSLLIKGFKERFLKQPIETSLIKIARLTAENPAKIFNVHNKGKIEVGYDADLVILDPEERGIIKKEDLFTKCGWSAYEGWEVYGRPWQTIVRGKIVYKEGKILQKAGKWIYS